VPRVVSYPTDGPHGYAEPLPLVLEATPLQGEFLILGESFSGPLAIQTAARQSAGLVGIVLCATFARKPVRLVPAWCGVCVRGWTVRLTSVRTVLRFALGSEGSFEFTRRIVQALQMVQPAVLAARVRALMSVDVIKELRGC